MLAATPQLNYQRPRLPDGDSGFTGVYMRKDAGAIPPGLLADGRNLRCRRNVAATRPGTARPVWANRTESATSAVALSYGTPYGAGVFKDPASLEWTLTAADGLVYRTTEGNPTSSIPLPAGVKILDECNLVQAFNQVYLFRGQYLQPLRLSNFDDGFQDILPRWAAATVYAPVIGGAPASEVAYGPFQAVSFLTCSGNTAIVVTTLAHGYRTGMDITLTGANQAEYNGRFNITVLSDTVFTYIFAGSATTPATGTIQCSNMARYWKARGSELLTGVTITFVLAVATVHKTAHGFSNSQSVTLSGATGADAPLYNITAVISNVTANTFDYTMSGTPAGVATGTIHVLNNTVVLAGQSPDTNPEAWQELFDILPNALAAAYVGNRLVLATAYNPDSGAYDAKTDYLVATDYLDETHFDFVNQFRINQGSDDEIVDLWEFAESGASSDTGTIIVGKSKSIHVLNNVQLDLSQVTRRTVIPDYGLAARGAWCVVGKDCYFLAESRGVVSITQTEQNKLQGVDLPLSDGIQDLIDRINWRLAAGARMAWWDSKLYVAVPLDAATVTGSNILPKLMPDNVFYAPVIVGETYRFKARSGEPAFSFDGGQTFFNSGDRVATSSPVFVNQSLVPGGQEIRRLFKNVNNAILVYDFLNQQWQGRDDGAVIIPQEWVKTRVYGRERLFFLSADGWMNLMEETAGGDQGNSLEPFTDYRLSRGYTQSTAQHKRGRKLALTLATWNPTYTIALKYSGVNKVTTLKAGETKDRTKYYQPWNAPAYDATNVNGDHTQPNRQDYSVPLTSAGIFLSGGLILNQLQETREAIKLVGNPARYVQVEITNTTGRLELRAVELVAQITERRKGVLV